jgi:hypothetical protein
LIKAIFLSKSNLDVTIDDNSKNDIYQKQLEISGEWDRMEYDLQDNHFWNFINKTNIASLDEDFCFNLDCGDYESLDWCSTKTAIHNK